MFRKIGELTAKALVQGGGGFHILSHSVYQYICGDSLSDLSVHVGEIPDAGARGLCQKVCKSL